MKTSILVSIFLSVGVAFVFSGCTSDSATTIVEALTQNSAPTANTQTITVAQDSSDNNITLSGSDIDEDVLTYSVETNTTNGTLSGTAPNLKYTPTQGYDGNDSLTFKVNDGTVDSDIVSVNIVVNPTENELPVPNAGADQTITEGDEVTLDASSSTDDGTIESYIWNEGLTLLNSTVSFTKTDFGVGTHTITLTVTDNQGATATDTVTITVNAVVVVNEAPTAQAGIDQTITEGASVTLDASSSSDDRTIESYIWNEGATQLSTTKSFTKIDFAVGTHTITLTVTDNQGATATDTVTITVNAVVVVNEIPIANAGADQTITEGDSVTLDASSSSDDGSIESYIWNEGLTLLNSTVSFTKTDFTVGTHTITLTVTDNQGATATDEVVIIVNVLANQVPVASDQNVTTDENVNVAITLSATDGDATDTLIYTLLSSPINGTLNGTVPNLTYIPTAGYSGSDSFTFLVNDGTVDSSIATVSITVNAILVPIKKTGQTKSYDTSGVEVTDSSLQDDGYYQTGQTSRYTSASDIVTDELTNLMWQDDTAAGLVTKPWLSQANYETCSADTTSSSCYDTSGDTAATYCSGLTLGGYSDWRLPTSKELENIVDYGKSYLAIDTNHFRNISSYYYWSSTTYEYRKYYALYVDFNNGSVSYFTKGSKFYFRCVRGGE